MSYETKTTPPLGYVVGRHCYTESGSKRKSFHPGQEADEKGESARCGNSDYVCSHRLCKLPLLILKIRNVSFFINLREKERERNINMREKR